MKNLLKINLIALGIMMASFAATAQKSSNFQVQIDAGLLSNGAGIRFFTGGNSVIHTLISVDHGFSAYRVTALYEEQQSVNAISGLSWYGGAGLHAGYKMPVQVADSKDAFNTEIFTVNGRAEPETSQPGGIFFGANVILGLQYHFGNGPISVSADLKPFVNFFNRESRLFDGSIRLGIDL